jgi:lysylphosphatidylglycerol synthetase-like protein (DUF2156 family)
MADVDTLLAERDAFRSEPVAVEHNPAGHGRTLGYFWLAYGIVRLIGAAALIVYSNTATLMFGALLSRVPNAFTLMSVFHFFYFCAVGLALLAGVVSILAGWNLSSAAASGRMLAILAALLSVSDIPFGTTLGAYTLAVLSPRR